jgi:ABC-type glycerol-3-phosphate transport system substrate-binding protein
VAVTRTETSIQIWIPQDVILTIAGSLEEYKALESTIVAFSEKYPNCKIEYEYLQDCSETLPKRLAGDDNKIDLFLTSNLQADSPYFPYALELYSQGEALDLSGTFDGLIQNFEFMDTEEGAAKQIYAIPFGGELRGLYVNKTLLDTLGIKVPTNRTEFLAACATLSDAGYVPIQGNPGSAGQQLMYPYVCNLVANADNYDELYQKINNCEEGISELFRDPMEFTYGLVEADYYQYKYIENEYGFFLESNDEIYARDFLNIVSEDGTNYVKKDDVGIVAFMPRTLSMGAMLEKTKADYHSEIEYEFILAPVADEGGFAYLSPTNGIAINKGSDYVDWAVEFMDFVFEPDNNVAFAEEDNIIPNTKDAYDFIKKEFDIPENQISELGEMTFDYNFYGVINETLVAISKANNPKYMQVDEAGNETMYPFEYYMQMLSDGFAASKE